jgi:hypothetical protein
MCQVHTKPNFVPVNMSVTLVRECVDTLHSSWKSSKLHSFPGHFFPGYDSCMLIEMFVSFLICF